MNIVIIGMGEVGKHIATVLLEEQHDVVIIDKNPSSLAAAEGAFDALVLQGHGASETTLVSANVHNADLVCAVTDNDEINMLAALSAKQLGAKRVIARVSNRIYYPDDRGLISDMFGAIDLVVNPKVLVAVELHKLVRSASAVAVEDFADNRIEMVQLPVLQRTSAVGKALRDLKLPPNTLIAAIDRDNNLIVPSGNHTIQAGDEVLCVGRIEQIPAIEKLFERERRRFVHKVFIIGGSEIGEHLAKALAADGIKVVMIDQDRERCFALKRSLPDTVTVLNADGTDMHILEEEGVDHCDAFVACSGADEINLMASLLAKQAGARRALALVHKPDYAKVCERLGIDATLSPRLTIAQQVLKYVRTGDVLSIRPVLSGRGEFLEFMASRDARITGTPIKDANFPRGANICAVVGHKGAYVPRGNDVIESGDRVVVFTTPKQRLAVERMFRKPTLLG